MEPRRRRPTAWETFHLAELPPLLEERYGAGRRRVVAGVSMEGFGALSYAARHPGMFRAAASFSGPVHLLHPEFVAVWPALVAAAEQSGVDLSRLWGDPVAQRRVWAAHEQFDPSEAVLRLANRSLAERLRRLGRSPVTFFHAGTHHPAYAVRALRRALPLLREALSQG